MSGHDPITASCSCGWSTSRDRRASNLPEENNIGIVESVVGCHNFTHEWKDEEHRASVDRSADREHHGGGA